LAFDVRRSLVDAEPASGAPRPTNIALRQQLATMVQKNRPRIRFADRVFWIVLRRLWARWLEQELPP
jgi:hypothetical protein